MRRSRARCRITHPSTARSSPGKWWRQLLAGKLSTAPTRNQQNEEAPMLRATRVAFLSFLVLTTVASLASGQTAAPTPHAPAQATTDAGTPVPPSTNTAAAQPFDINAAVEAYLAKMPPARRARSNSYFEGGYWLQLWDFLATVFVMWLLLRFRWSAGMRNLAERITRFRPLQTAIYWIQFIIVMSVLTFPLTVYEGY